MSKRIQQGKRVNNYPFINDKSKRITKSISKGTISNGYRVGFSKPKPVANPKPTQLYQNANGLETYKVKTTKKEKFDFPLSDKAFREICIEREICINQINEFCKRKFSIVEFIGWKHNPKSIPNLVCEDIIKFLFGNDYQQTDFNEINEKYK